MGPMINDEFSDVTFALFALKAKESHSVCWLGMRSRYVSVFSMWQV